jgi:excisionase family DNA binding protein
MQSHWLSVDEIAVPPGVSGDMVYRWIEHCRLPAHKIGRLWQFKAEEVNERVRAGKAADNNISWHGRPPEHEPLSHDSAKIATSPSSNRKPFSVHSDETKKQSSERRK